MFAIFCSSIFLAEGKKLNNDDDDDDDDGDTDDDDDDDDGDNDDNDDDGEQDLEFEGVDVPLSFSIFSSNTLEVRNEIIPSNRSVCFYIFCI
jgi:hypothetical protein